MINNFFVDKEIECNCGCHQLIDNDDTRDHFYKLILARLIANKPFIVNSWNRCVDHNNKVGGSKTSSHLMGIATDIKCHQKDRLVILGALIKANFKRIIVYHNFIHCDTDLKKRSGLWYKNGSRFL